MVTAEMHVTKNHRFFVFRVEFEPSDCQWLNDGVPVLLRSECRVLRLHLASDACVAANVGRNAPESIEYAGIDAAMLRRGTMVVTVYRGVAW